MIDDERRHRHRKNTSGIEFAAISALCASCYLWGAGNDIGFYVGLVAIVLIRWAQLRDQEDAGDLRHRMYGARDVVLQRRRPIAPEPQRPKRTPSTPGRA